MVILLYLPQIPYTIDVQAGVFLFKSTYFGTRFLTELLTDMLNLFAFIESQKSPLSSRRTVIFKSTYFGTRFLRERLTDMLNLFAFIEPQNSPLSSW